MWKASLDISQSRLFIYSLESQIPEEEDEEEEVVLRERFMGDFELFLDDFEPSSSILYCRICHEAEFESARSLESPCSCSGTAKFAHRDCIQRWCDEKGNTICEICLQKYEPGYRAACKNLQQSETALMIRDSLQFPRTEEDPQSPSALASSQGTPISPEQSRCSSPANGNVSRSRSLALTFMIVLLVRHLFEVLVFGTEDDPFTLLTVLLLRATGIIFPIFILSRIIATLKNNIFVYNQHQDSEEDDRQNIPV